MRHGQCKNKRFAKQHVGGNEAARCERPHDAQLDTVGADGFELISCLHFAQRHLHLGQLRLQGCQQGRQQGEARRRDEAQGHTADIGVHGATRRQRGCLAAAQNVLGLAQKNGTRQRQPHGTTGTVQQAHAHLVLQQLDLARQRRLGHVQQGRRTTEMQFGGDGHEAAQVGQLEHDSHLVLRHPVFGLDAVAEAF